MMYNDEACISHYKMIHVSKKRPTQRRAVACGKIKVSEDAFSLIKNKALPKGDPLPLAEMAGIMAAKGVSEQLVLCHPIELELVDIQSVLDDSEHAVIVYATVAAFSKTGVEMEALAAVNAALLSIYDLVKNVEPALEITGIRLLVKEGGKHGLWIHPEGIPKHVLDSFDTLRMNTLKGRKVSLITVSDRASQNIYPDKSGQSLKDILERYGFEVVSYHIVPDEEELLIECIENDIRQHAPQVIFLTGGTGIAKRDITPEVVSKMSNKLIPGIGEMLRTTGAYYTSYSFLSRSIAGIYEQSMLISLPGNPKAIEQSLPPIIEILPHALNLLGKEPHDIL